MTPDTYRRHALTLAKDTGATLEGVEMVTDHMAKSIADAAIRAESRCPGEGDWLGTAMACNAAPNKHARAIIEHKAALLYAARPVPAA